MPDAAAIAPARLHATFTRSASRRDRAVVTLANGATRTWNWPTSGDRLPHDLFHLVVESVLGLDHGFWALVSAGVDAAARCAAHEPDPDAPALATGVFAQLTQAEAACSLLAPRWLAPPLTDASLATALAAACARQRVPLPAGATPEALHHSRSLLLALGKRWAGLGPDQSISVRFPLPLPVTRAATESALVADRQHASADL